MVFVVVVVMVVVLVVVVVMMVFGGVVEVCLQLLQLTLRQTSELEDQTSIGRALSAADTLALCTHLGMQE